MAVKKPAGALPKGGGQAASGKQLVQPTKTSSTSGSSKASNSELQAYVDSLKGITGALGGLVPLLGQLDGGSTAGGAGIVNPGNRSDESYIAEGMSGTSNTGKNYINGKLATPEEWSKFLYGDTKPSGGGGASGPSVNDLEREARNESLLLSSSDILMFLVLHLASLEKL